MKTPSQIPPTIGDEIDTVRASRAGHTFHERWAARRALQLVFPNDGLFAIAVEGLSSTETASPGAAAEEVADLVLYYGTGDNFRSCERLETAQFKYKVREEPVTASFLKKTIGKFCDTLIGYEKDATVDEIDRKVSFLFVTNAPFTTDLWNAVSALKNGTNAPDEKSRQQATYLKTLCAEHGVPDAQRLFMRTEFRAADKSLAAHTNALRRTLVDWSAGADAQAKNRLHDLQELVLKKAGPSGQRKNLIKREDVLDALDCLPEDLFPAETRFIDVGAIVERAELGIVDDLIKNEDVPVFLHADGGVGKTVFVQSLAEKLTDDFEVVLFDCFGGGAYRSKEHARHLPNIGIIQIVNELASRGLCDLLLPGSDDAQKILKAARKRLSQAARAIQTQSGKRGLLLIIDAADNAQLEADRRGEDAFPKLLLSSADTETLDGVKLLLTARTHRMADVIGRANVKRFELGPFTEIEARRFLEDRKPTISEVEFATALARSGRNARVLDYLVQTWDVNVKGNVPATPITVPEIIAQQCEKIFSDLDVAGWPEREVREFFVALSLLPPPIPLGDLADALGWSSSQVNTAASDLAPMLEVTSHGAIFRDEPTETYVHDTYAGHTAAQAAIADRLMVAQNKSTYAAEALPHFLVIIGDEDRAFALAESSDFPPAIQSEFGRRRLTLARLRAAFKLAVDRKDNDRILNIVMRLAQVASANMRGDEFIRRSPALAVKLGDPDAQRRLFADRSGWRGARSARLTISHSFSGDLEEALIHRESTIRWINWFAEQPEEEWPHGREGPKANDFVAALFQTALQGNFESVDRNLATWSLPFSLSVSGELLHLIELYEITTGEAVLAGFVSFVVSDRCTSLALKMKLLSLPRLLSKAQARIVAKSIHRAPIIDEDEIDTRSRKEGGVQGEVIDAALSALLLSSRAYAKSIVKNVPKARPSGYDYGERYGHPAVWHPVLAACVRCWSDGKPLSYHHILPSELKITKRARAIGSKDELRAFLDEQMMPTSSRVDRSKGPRKKTERPTARYDRRERDEIASGIEMIIRIVEPIQRAVLAREPLSSAHSAEFITGLQTHIRSNIHWRSETSTDLLARTVGLGCIRLLLTYGRDIGTEHAEAIVNMVSGERFAVYQKLLVLELLARRPAFYDLSGKFAQHVSEQIRKEDNIGSRGELYADLAAALVPMSIDEAREYYRQGLAQLDQLGGEDYEQIYALLHYAATQPGGPISPARAQRLMNLCQLISQHEPSKFGWTLFARAAATSIGFPAVAKLVRWDDQDVVDISYALPQLACFLAKAGRLSPRRAAFFLTICEDHGWWDWQLGEGVSDLLSLSGFDDQRRIVRAVLRKLRAEHGPGGWTGLWESLLRVADDYPGVLTHDQHDELRQLRDEARQQRDEYNSRNNPSYGTPPQIDDRPTEEEVGAIIKRLVDACDPTSSASIDEALKSIDEDKRLSFSSRKEFIRQLCSSCPYPDRLGFLNAICDASEWELDRSIGTLVDAVAEWKGSSAHLSSKTNDLVARVLEQKGAYLFYEGYSNVTRRIHQLTEFCGDERFVLDQALKAVAADEAGLDGEEWLQLATSLSSVASGDAARAALELFLSGPASRIADEVGEGVLTPQQEIVSNGEEFFADVLWHLLGDDDAYVRWNIARGISTLVDLGLESDLGLLLDRFDKTEIPALASTGRILPYQNSQEWLLIGIARAALYHGAALAFLRPQLVALSARDDIHIMHKVHIARCLQNIGCNGVPDVELQAIRAEIDAPKHGTIVSDGWPENAEPKSGFAFDYEFNKSEIESVARMFGISHGAAVDALADEIKARWPEAQDLAYFGGHDRYRRDRHDRYENARDHVQKHALFSAVTKLAATKPVVVRSYESADVAPWREWRDRYDITFEDGSWLSDRKDAVPKAARESLLGPRNGQQETLRDQDVLLTKIGLTEVSENEAIPIYAQWSSPDGVSVSIVTALTEPKGAIGRCASFSKLSSYDFWLPQLWDEGYYNRRHRDETVFTPLIWAPENHRLGIDQADEIAAHNAASRPRLGIELTKRLSLVPGSVFGEWHASDGSVALKSQVWGGWEPDQNQRGHHHHVDGEILFASQEWLDAALAQLNMRLVYSTTFWKYRSSREYETSSGVKSVLLGLRSDTGALRLWRAKKASLQD